MYLTLSACLINILCVLAANLLVNPFLGCRATAMINLKIAKYFSHSIFRYLSLSVLNRSILVIQQLNMLGHVALDFSAIPKLYGPENFWHWRMLLRSYLEAADLWKDDHPRDVRKLVQKRLLNIK